MPEARLDPETVKAVDADAVPGVVLKADKVPVVVITGLVGLTVMVNVIGAPVQIDPPAMKFPNVLRLPAAEILLVTVLVAVLITNKLFKPLFPESMVVMYTLLPSGLTDTP